jgi:hypothetical protein
MKKIENVICCISHYILHTIAFVRTHKGNKQINVSKNKKIPIVINKSPVDQMSNNLEKKMKQILMLLAIK